MAIAPCGTVVGVVQVVFVAPYVMEATNRFLAAMIEVPGADVAVVSSDPIERFPDRVRAGLCAHWRIDDCLDADQLTNAVAALSDHFDRVDVLTAILENLQVPLAEVRERLDIGGMDVATAGRFGDKAAMKAAFTDAGIPCARNARADSAGQVRDILRQWEQPIVVKPLAGMGARNTFRVDSGESMHRWLAHSPPSSQAPVLIEEFLVGQEFSYESVLIDGEEVVFLWHGEARDVAVAGDMIGMRREERMFRLEGTDLWWVVACSEQHIPFTLVELAGVGHDELGLELDLHPHRE